MDAQGQPRRRRPLVIAVVAGPEEASEALAMGADAIAPAGPEPAVDCDSVAASLPAVVAVAAISAWRGEPAVRTRHVLPVRRAVDMTLVIRGDQPPACTVRGLA